MGTTSIQLVADEYLNTLNPIAIRISVDVTSTKEAYEHVWNTLSYAEQRQVIDETIIHPEAVLKYAFERSLEKPEISPTLNLESDGKFILDDDCSKVRNQTLCFFAILDLALYNKFVSFDSGYPMERRTFCSLLMVNTKSDESLSGHLSFPHCYSSTTL